MKSAARIHTILATALFLAAGAALCQTAQAQQRFFGSPLMTQPLLDDNAPDPVDVGKILVIGRLKTIDNAKLVIVRPDGVDQLVIAGPATRCFGDHGNATTLSAFKVGELVYAIGTTESGDFMATKLLKAPSPGSTPPSLQPN